MKEKQQIAICSSCVHGGHEIPMIGTMAFMGSEMWCPRCGNSTGFPFGEFKQVDETEKLRSAYEVYVAHSAPYLSAYSTMVCDSMMIDGENVKRADFPKEMLQAARDTIDQGWETGHEASELIDVDLMRKHLDKLAERFGVQFTKMKIAVDDALQMFLSGSIDDNLDLGDLERSIEQSNEFMERYNRINEIITAMDITLDA